MRGIGLLILHVLELSETLLNSHLQILADTLIIMIFLIILLQLSVLVLQFSDLLLLDSHHNVFLLEILLQKDIVNLVALLHDNQVVVGMGQLADVVLQLHQLLLHVLLVFHETLLGLCTFLLLGLEILK